MTVALYARRKGWPLEEMIVRLSHSRIHATDCAECETKEGLLDRVEWSLQFTEIYRRHNGPDCWRLRRCVLSIAHFALRFTFRRQTSLRTYPLLMVSSEVA